MSEPFVLPELYSVYQIKRWKIGLGGEVVFSFLACCQSLLISATTRRPAAAAVNNQTDRSTAVQPTSQHGKRAVLELRQERNTILSSSLL